MTMMTPYGVIGWERVKDRQLWDKTVVRVSKSGVDLVRIIPS